ncbi:MAG: hypothetical protein Ta2E_13150 [Mycoplasmoidaceae bacterium]|nr:MAG: hypothetical protein Ta2E_13150 [Mycoplasmoidaceae bacterium]
MIFLFFPFCSQLISNKNGSKNTKTVQQEINEFEADIELSLNFQDSIEYSFMIERLAIELKGWN